MRWVRGHYLLTLALAFCIRCDGGGGSWLDRCRAKRLIPGCLSGHICGGGSVHDRAHRHSTTRGSPGHPVQLGILDVQDDLGARTELPSCGRRRLWERFWVADAEASAASAPPAPCREASPGPRPTVTDRAPGHPDLLEPAYAGAYSCGLAGRAPPLQTPVSVAYAFPRCFQWTSSGGSA